MSGTWTSRASLSTAERAGSAERGTCGDAARRNRGKKVRRAARPGWGDEADRPSCSSVRAGPRLLERISKVSAHGSGVVPRREYPRNMPELPLPAALAQATVLDREGDIYQRLLKERIIFLGTQVEDQSANL